MASRSKKSAMKKDNADKSSRPSSRMSPRGSITLGSAPMGLSGKVKQLQENLTRENTDLQSKNELLIAENQLMKDKLETLTNRIVESASSKGYNLEPEDKDKPSVELPVDSLLNLLNSLTMSSVKKKNQKGSVEARIEELETRITHLNMELAKLLQMRINAESTLNDIQNCDTIEEAKNKARFLYYEMQGSEMFTFLSTEPESDEEENVPEEKPVIESLLPQPGYKVENIVKNLKQFELHPPSRKLPGDTHISKMDVDLQKYIINELSLYKGNGADWRLLADRVGISSETVQQWKRWKLEYPMQYVLQTWGKSSAATMRLLHRHLVSPQMRAILLAKRITDFYQVD